MGCIPHGRWWSISELFWGGESEEVARRGNRSDVGRCALTELFCSCRIHDLQDHMSAIYVNVLAI